MSRMPIAEEATTSGLAKALAEVEATRGWIPNALRAFSHSPEGLRRFAALGEYVRFETNLSPRIRELTVITIARACNYAWTHHIPFAQLAGVTEPEIAAVKNGLVPDSLDSAERLALGYVHAFLTGKTISDKDFAELLEAIGPRAMTDLTLLAGYFLTLGWVLNTFEVDVEPRETLERYWRSGGRGTSIA